MLVEYRQWKEDILVTALFDPDICAFLGGFLCNRRRLSIGCMYL